MIPLGVYLPGESLPASLTADLQRLQAHGVNSLWVTHLTSTLTADVARVAAGYGMQIVASVGDLDVAGPAQSWKRNDAYYRATIPAVLTAWGTAPRPLAWGLGDEPQPTIIDAYRDYVKVWRELAPAEPITLVVNRGGVPMYSTLGLQPLSEFAYPFFVDYAPETSIAYYLAACSENRKGWMMCQAFGKPDVWKVPTPAQVSWQVYAAFACGCRGMFAFVWSHLAGPEQLTTLPMLPLQLASLGSAYVRIRGWPMLEPATHQRWQTVTGPGGSLAGYFVTPQGRYVLAVCGPDAAATLSIPVQSWFAQDVSSGKWSTTFRGILTAKLGAGEGRMWRLI